MFVHEGGSGSLCQRISLATIDKVVAARLGQTRAQGNAQPAVFNRQIAMYLAKHVGGWSTTRIGRFYNGRDHSTVCHALKKIENLRISRSDVDELLVTLKSEIGSEVQGNSAATQNAVSHPAPRTGEALLTDEFLDLLVDRLVDRLRSRMVKELDLLNPIVVEAERAVPGKNVRNGRNATLHGPKMDA